MKWYFACSKGSNDFYPLLKAAVNSAIENTTLEPNFIYDGEPDELTEWLENKGVNVIYHRVSFADKIMENFSEYSRKIPLGAYLRCDIPIIEKDDEIVLYTDCDVLFLKDINEQNSQKPKYFSCSSQFNKRDFFDFNTGVMFMNVKKLRESHKDFTDFIKQNIMKLPVFDQSAYQFFYGNKNEPLDIKYNHKPYWGINENSVILHFHGAKPTDFAAAEKLKYLPEIYLKFYKKNPQAYDHYLEIFKKYFDISYNYDAIKLLKSGVYPIKEVNKKPLKQRIINFFSKRYNRFKSIFRNIS